MTADRFLTIYAICLALGAMSAARAAGGQSIGSESTTTATSTANVPKDSDHSPTFPIPTSCGPSWTVRM